MSKIHHLFAASVSVSMPVALVLVALIAAPAHGLEIRIDFAANSSTGNPGGNWNTLSSASGSIADLTDFATGSPSNVSLTVTDNLGGPGNSNAGQWAGTPAFRSWINPVATNDYHFVQASSGNPVGQITFAGAGLDPNKTYRVEILGSRSNSNTNGTFRMGGALSDNLNSDLYSAFADGYQAHQVMTWRSVKPVAGQLVLDLDNVVPYAAGYLSAMRITDAPDQTILFDLGSSGRQTPGRWNNATSRLPGHGVLGAVDAAGIQTGIGLSVLDPFDDVNPWGIDSDAAGFAATAQSDSFAIAGGGTGTMQIEGLDPAKQYDVTLFGSRAGTGRTAAYTINGTTQNLLNSDNTSNSVTFTGVSPDAHGHLQIDTSVASGGFGYLGVVEIAGTFAASAQPMPSLFFDFGSAASGYTTSGNWNNVTTTTAGLKIDGAVDSIGQTTGVDLTISNAFGGINSVGALSNDAGFPSTAQRDSFFLVGTDTGQIVLDGLDSGLLYDFTFFGSRQTAGAPTPPLGIEVQIGSRIAALDVLGNTQNVIALLGIHPDSSGQVLIDVRVPAGANLAYFGAMQVTAVVPEPGTLVLLGLGVLGLLPAVRRRRRK